MVELRHKLKLIISDFDGVFTNNKVLVFEDGREAVQCSRSDGLGLRALRSAGIETVVVSSETNRTVRARCEKLDLKCYDGVIDKGAFVRELVGSRDVSFDEILGIGNDINDLSFLRLVGIASCPGDACREVRDLADIVYPSFGGDGVFRDLAEVLGVLEWHI